MLEIRSRNPKAEIDQHLRDAGHADAADAYGMDVLNSAKHLILFSHNEAHQSQKRISADAFDPMFLLHFCAFCAFLWLNSSIMSTAAAAASPCASFLLASSMRSNSCGDWTSFSISVAKRSPPNSCCKIICAAPAASS